VTVAAVLLLLLVLIVLRFPIGLAMLVAGFTGFAAVTGVQPALKMVGQTVYATGFDYALAVLPLFILMGNLGTTAAASRWRPSSPAAD
jgi:C4-dicarboxylate transporter DctM subunit